MVSAPHPSNSSGLYNVVSIPVCIKVGKPVIALKQTASSQYPSLTKQSDPEKCRMICLHIE